MENKFLGKGWTFPPEFFGGGAELQMISGEEDIRQSLQILLSTSLDERMMSPDYGCNLNKFMFEPANSGLVNELESLVSRAILLNEPRIAVDKVNVKDINPDNGLIEISVDYTVRTTNNRFNLVYPFYINEASI